MVKHFHLGNADLLKAKCMIETTSLDKSYYLNKYLGKKLKRINFISVFPEKNFEK